MCGYDKSKVVFLTHGTQPVLPDFELAVIVEALQVCTHVCLSLSVTLSLYL